MTDIAVTKNFKSHVWQDAITGTGTITYSQNSEGMATTAGDIVHCAGDNVSRAMKVYRTTLSPLETIEFDVMCRVEDGFAVGEEGGIYIESNNVRVAEINLENEDWERSQTIRYTAEFNQEYADRDISIFIGSSNTRNNTTHFAQPIVRKYGGVGRGAVQPTMYGVINITATGVVTMHGSSTEFNVDQGRFEAVGATKELKIWPHGRDRVIGGIQGIPIVQQIRGPSTNNPRYHYEARVINADNILQIAAYDSAGVLKNINALGFAVRLMFMIIR